MDSLPMELSWSYRALAAPTTADIFPVGVGENTEALENEGAKRRDRGRGKIN